MGPVAMMLHHMKALGWTLSDRLAITKRHGTTMHLTKGEDQLFDHWLREDLRRMIWARDLAVRNRGDLREIAGTNIDYTSTVQMMCAKKKQKRQGGTVPDGQENRDSFQLSPKQRVCTRSILGGAVPTVQGRLAENSSVPFLLDRTKRNHQAPLVGMHSH